MHDFRVAPHSYPGPESALSLRKFFIAGTPALFIGRDSNENFSDTTVWPCPLRRAFPFRMAARSLPRASDHANPLFKSRDCHGRNFISLRGIEERSQGQATTPRRKDRGNDKNIYFFRIILLSIFLYNREKRFTSGKLQQFSIRSNDSMRGRLIVTFYMVQGDPRFPLFGAIRISRESHSSSMGRLAEDETDGGNSIPVHSEVLRASPRERVYA